jgi:dolichyl-phosphate-mannose-protein mannosyltransferase
MHDPHTTPIGLLVEEPRPAAERADRSASQHAAGRASVGLGLAIAVAVVLRVWGIGFGLPHTITRPDEDATVSIAVGLFTRSLNPHFFDWPTLFMYGVAAAFAVYFQIGRVAGWFADKSAFVAAVSEHPSPLFRIARGVSAAAGVMTVATVHAIGVRLFDRTTALIAACFLAVAALHARDSHFGVTDITATWLVTLAFLYTVRWSAANRRRDAVFAAVLAGLAASTKYNAGLIVAPLAVAILRSREPRRWALLAACLVASVLAFLCGTPYALVDRAAFLAALASISEHLRAGHAAMAGPAWIVHLTSSLRYGLGLPLLVAGIAGLVSHTLRNRRDGVVFVVFPVIYFAFIGAGQTAFARYILPVVPFLCLAAAHFVVEIARGLALHLRRIDAAPAIAWIGAALIAAPSAMATIETDRLLARTDTRLIAAEWIHREYPHGVAMAQTGTVAGQVQMSTADEIGAARYRTVELDRASGTFAISEGGAASSPEIVVVAECALSYCGVSDQMRKVLHDQYELRQTFTAADTSHAGLVYDRDDEFYVPLAGFGAVTYPGPNISVYRRR